MARERSPNRDKAKKMYLDSKGEIKLVDIAATLSIKDSQVRKWKSQDKWDEELKGTLPKRKRSVTIKQRVSKNECLSGEENKSKEEGKTNSRKIGAPKGNKNALGNKGGPGGPYRNKKAEKHGFFSKYLPEDTLDILTEIEEKSPIDMLWDNITIQYAAIIRAQRIMYVESKEEMIKELKKKKEVESTTSDTFEEEYEFQFAWDRQATFLNAQSRAISELRSSIKQYEEMLKSDLATEEQKLRIAKLKGEVNKIESGEGNTGPIEILIKRKGED